MGWLERHFVAVMGASLVAATLLCALAVPSMLQSGLTPLLALGLILLLAVCLGDVALLVVPDELRVSATQRTLRLTSNVLAHTSGGLTKENCQAICQLLLPETKAMAVAMTDTEVVLAYVGESSSNYPPGSPISTPATYKVLESGKLETFTSLVPETSGDPQDLGGVVPAGIVVPLIVGETTIGTIKFYYRHRRDMDRAQLAIAHGFGEVLSTQFSAAELDRQVELTAKAEVKALQAQINPHFLFNTLNTIAALTRTDPTQARDLLREFAAFYRQTLENSESRISLASELEQTRRYLKFEHARFGEDRIIEREHIAPGCEDLPVPAFMVQPLVENAVRHAMRDEGPLHIDIHVARDEADVLISVTDDGLGMNEATAERLRSRAAGPDRNNPRGTGMALRNVAERVKRFYGSGSGLEIMSRPGEGTSVTVRLAGVASELE